MTEIIIHIEDEKTERTVEALAYHWEYQDFVLNEKQEEIPNPETKQEFVLLKLAQMLTHTIQDAELNFVMRTLEVNQKQEAAQLMEETKILSKELGVTVTFK